jgi:hypothetical protein
MVTKPVGRFFMAAIYHTIHHEPCSLSIRKPEYQAGTNCVDLHKCNLIMRKFITTISSLTYMMETLKPVVK